jgi:hypothetical protein
MLFFRMMAIGLVMAAAQAAAQPAGRVGSDRPIVVTGTKDAQGRPIRMSDWRVAETGHVLVYSQGDERQLMRIAHNLEKLHFLLSMLFDRVDEQDDTIRLSVTLIGDAADFHHLGLRNLRWQQGPYPRAFPDELYYDPREDGAVLATAQQDQSIVLEQGVALSSLDLRAQQGVVSGPGAEAGAEAMPRHDMRANSVALPMSAEGRLYAGFARHYLMTYFPNAYPRWYLEGFGEIFATFAASQDGVIEYGRAPEGYRDVIERYGRVPLRDILDGSYLDEPPSRTRWTPYHAWALVHLLFFSEEWKEPLLRYLGAAARGAGEVESEAALGDLGKLQAELTSYRGRKVPFERLTYPPDRTPPPMVRRLRESEAARVRGRLELGARIEVPPPPPPGADAKTARAMNEARADALREREAWLDRLRANAARYPNEAEGLLLLAEAECRSGNFEPCLAAADRALALLPDSADGLGWKGNAAAQLAIRGPAKDRQRNLRAARKLIVAANRADPEAVQPLLNYYRSFVDAGEKPPEAAIAGLMKAVDSVPAAPTPRVMLGAALVGRGEIGTARQVLRPVAVGAYQSPERPRAEALLRSIPPQ